MCGQIGETGTRLTDREEGGTFKTVCTGLYLSTSGNLCAHHTT